MSATAPATAAGRQNGGEQPLLKMSELAERSGVSAGTIRYYLREGLLGEGRDIIRTSRNMAYYPASYVQRIELIKRLQRQRFMPLRLIKGALEQDPERVHALVERFRRAMPGLALDVAQLKVQLDGAEDALDSPFPVRWKYINPDDYMTIPLDEPVKLRAGDPVGLEED